MTMYESCWQYFASADTDGIPDAEEDILTIRTQENDGMVVVTFNATEEQSIYIHLSLDDTDRLLDALKKTREDVAAYLAEKREEMMSR